MTEEQQIAYETKGYLVIDDALDADKILTVYSALDDAAARNALGDLPNRDDCFIHLAEHPVLFPVIHGIMSDDVALRSVGGRILTTGAPGRGWHTLVATMLGVNHPTSNVFLRVIISLDATPINAGCPAVVPESHLFKPDASYPPITRIEEMPDYQPLRLPAGSAAILHGNLQQARLGHEAAEPLRFLEYTYIHCWMRQDLPELSPGARTTIVESPNLTALFGSDPERRYWDTTVVDYPSSPEWDTATGRMSAERNSCHETGGGQSAIRFTRIRLHPQGLFT